jgi:hypothetical protein
MRTALLAFDSASVVSGDSTNAPLKTLKRIKPSRVQTKTNPA